ACRERRIASGRGTVMEWSAVSHRVVLLSRRKGMSQVPHPVARRSLWGSLLLASSLLLGAGLIAYSAIRWQDSQLAAAPTLRPPGRLVVAATPQAGGTEPERIPAPELEGGTGWLNTAGPLRLKDLRGKIVLLDFWTLC